MSRPAPVLPYPVTIAVRRIQAGHDPRRVAEYLCVVAGLDGGPSPDPCELTRARLEGRREAFTEVADAIARGPADHRKPRRFRWSA